MYVSFHAADRRGRGDGGVVRALSTQRYFVVGLNTTACVRAASSAIITTHPPLIDDDAITTKSKLILPNKEHSSHSGTYTYSIPTPPFSSAGTRSCCCAVVVEERYLYFLLLYRRAISILRGSPQGYLFRSYCCCCSNLLLFVVIVGGYNQRSAAPTPR